MEENIGSENNQNFSNNFSKDRLALLDKILKTNLLPLAFIGDSVHTLFVREYVLNSQSSKMANYHSTASRYCQASMQAKVLLAFLPNLSQEEQDIVRRGRNAKPKHHAKNSSVTDYFYATAFEVLVGYLYLKGDSKRLEKLLNFSLTL